MSAARTVARVRLADRDRDHETLVRIARQSRFTRDFASTRYSGPDAYDRGWVAVAENEGGGILGFVCIRVRQDAIVSLYFLCVRPWAKRSGVGRELHAWAVDQSPSGTVRLKVDHFNRAALDFWSRLGYRPLPREESAPLLQPMEFHAW